MPRSSSKPQPRPARAGARPDNPPAAPRVTAGRAAGAPVRWPVHPVPLAEELRTSWLARVGAAYGASPPQLCHLAWWTVRPLRGPRDLDIGVDPSGGGSPVEGVWRPTPSRKRPDLDEPLAPALVTALATVTGQPAPRIAALGHGALAWPLAAGRVQWCPRCLAGDAIPYLRQGWRDALTVCCPSHRQVLVDQCAVCRAPLALPPSRAVWPVGGARPVGRERSARRLALIPAAAWLTQCQRCGADRRGAAVPSARPHWPEPPASEWARLVAFEAVRANGQLLLPQPSGAPVRVDGCSYLDGLWTLIRCVTTGLGVARQRRAWVARWLGLCDFALPAPGFFATWNVWVRRRVLRMVLAMLDDWPERFRRLCQGPLVLGQYRFCGPAGRAPPSWLTAIAWPEVARGRATQPSWWTPDVPALRPGPWAPRARPPRVPEERSWLAYLLTPDEDDDLESDAYWSDV